MITSAMGEYNTLAPLAGCPKGGKVRWSPGNAWPPRRVGGSSTLVSARPADSTPTVESPASIGPSTGFSLLPTSAPAGWWRASSPASRARAASPAWPAFRAWTATPSPAGGATCAGLSGGRVGCGGRGPGASASKKKSPGPEGPGGVAPGYGGGRPGLRPAVDASVAPQAPEGPAPPGPAAGAGDDRPAAAPAGLLPEDVSQAASGPSGPPARPPVPPHRPDAQVVPGQGVAGDQRGHQEEGVGRQLQEPRPHVAAARPGGARP